MKQRLTQRIVSLFLVLTMVLGIAVPVGATTKPGMQTSESLAFSPVEEDISMSSIAEPVDIDSLTEEPLYADTDMVRVSIVMEEASTIEAGFSTQGISANQKAMAYRSGLKQNQAQVTARIESALGSKLDVQWNLTLVANLISANVPYGQIAEIEAVSGVKSVILETRYDPAVVQQEQAEPTMIAATPMTGADYVWAAGYTGAGTRIAIIDTGLDTDHQSFDEAAFQYSLAYQAGLKDMDAEDYIESLNLLTAEDVTKLADELNRPVDTTQTYLNSKVPFAYNYIDADYDITHDNDTQGGHGSHVAGIASANAFIPAEDGSFANALTATHVQGVAPDAQLLIMKVFGKGGGAYDADYMAAIEDAIILGCDSVNLSLGSASPGFSNSIAYQDFLNTLVDCDTAVIMAAGNAGSWADYSATGVPNLYAEDVNFDTVGSPGSFTNALTVASANNNSQHIQYILVGDTMMTYNQSAYSNAPIVTIAGDYEYVFIDGLGSPEEWDAVGDALEGKVAVCSRGTLSFSEKANNAVSRGAAAVIIYNNTDGSINMDLTDYIYDKPVVSITQAFGAVMKQNAQSVEDREGNVIYYLGELTIAKEPGIISSDSEYVTMSSYSSWGVAGTLILKPEITTPGGSIYSVDGEVDGGKAYVTNSGTSMAAPHSAGLAALVAQYVRENDLAEKTGLRPRHLVNSLLMSTATPEIEEASGNYWSVMKQGAGMANAAAAISSGAYILMGEDATASWKDGKVKAELGHDPERTGRYSFTFTVNNFSEEDKSYTLNSDFFTQGTFQQDGIAYLDTKTTPVAADVTYMVDGEIFRPTATLICDLDHDGDTDADDAQLILEYCIDNIDSIDPAADVSGDGVISTYDAHMILNNLETQAFTVTPGGSVTVQVNVTYGDSLKAWLDETYVNGAYIEGYVFALPVTTEEGEMGVTHSIPVLGFYGDWNDPSYFEKSNYWDKQYGTGKTNYTPYDREVGAMFVAKQNSGYVPAKEANPYMIEDEVPYDRLAVRSDDQLYMIPLTTIRPASAIAAVSLDENGQVIRLLNVENQGFPAFYYTNAGQWTNVRIYKFLVTHFGAMGASEGEKVNFGFVTIPEFYVPTVQPSTEQILDTINSGILGDGCYQIYSMMIDNTAPQLLDVTKNLMTGALTITATDAHYIASIQILSADGMTVYANVLPEATEAGETTVTTIDLSGMNVGSECIVALGDYAGNETLCTINYGGEDTSELGNLYGYTPYTDRDEHSGWYKIDPDTLWYYGRYDNGGMVWQADCDLAIRAAEYVDGKVFVAAEDGNFYVTDHGKWDEFAFVCNYSSVASNLYDMAYNPVNGLIYFTQGSASTLYTMNPATGEVAKGPAVEGTKPAGGAPIYRYMRSIAITADGTFYTTNWGGSATSSYVYSFTLDQIATNKKVNPVGSGTALGVSTAQKPTLTWDEADQKLYLVNNVNAIAGDTQILYTVDMETGVAVRANTDPYYAELASRLEVSVPVLYTISDTDGHLSTVDTATGLSLNHTALTVLSGATTTLKASVTPWNLSNKALNWSSSDNSVVTVAADGTIAALKPGTATITVTSAATPGVSAQCVVTVETAPELELTAQVTDSTGSWWVDFSTADPAGYTKLAESSFFAGGAIIDNNLFDDELLVYSKDYNNMYGMDMDSFKLVSDYGYLEDGWFWSDAAPCPATKDGHFGGVATITHRGRYFMVETPNTSTEDYWVLTEVFLNDPMALIAYVETSTYSGNPATWYKVLTEGGALYDLVYFTADMGTTYQVGLGYIGESGIKLPSAGAVVDVSYGSMVYDEASGYLVVVASGVKTESAVYFVDPDTAIATKAGSFGSDVEFVTTLTQYKRAETLEVILDKYEASLYLGDSLTMHAKVRPANYENGVTWTSNDTSVLTIDENGIVTALKEGTATVTATSTATDDQGNPATASCTITVKPLASLDTTISAQVETKDGLYWMDIDLSDMSTETVHTADVKYIGGGYTVAGNIYGSVGNLTDGGWQWATYPDEDYASRRYWYGPFNGSSMILDATTAPAFTFNYKKEDHVMFGSPVYISANAFIGACKQADPIGANSSAARGMNMSAAAGAGAIAFYDWRVVKTYNSTSGTPYYDFLVLANTGMLYKVTIKGDPNDSFTGYYMALSYSALGNVGMNFKNYDALSMTTYRDVEKGINGLIVSDASYGKVSLYFIDMNAETLECAKIGDLEGAIDLSCMYNDFSKITDINQVPTAAQAGYTNSNSVTEPADMGNMTVFSAATEPATTLTADDDTATATEADENVTITEGKVEVNLTEAVDVTNGIVKITYDTTVLDFTGMTSPLTHNAYRVNADAGIIYFDYASAWSVPAETVLGTLKFTFDAGCMNTNVKVSTIQRDDINTVTDETKTINLVYADGGHTWTVIDYLAPTCFTDGYETQLCTVCGETQTIILEANSDNCPCKRFTDLDNTQWYHEGIDFVLENGLMTGMSETKFAPNGTLTRAQVVTVLYRLAGEPGVDGLNNPFTDVAEDQWYTDAIVWAAGEGVVKGMTDTLFAPSEPITREQLVTIMFRYSGESAVEEDFLADYADAAKVSAYAVDAMNWAIANGIIEGVSETQLSPKTTSTRAQYATILERYVNG